MNQDDQKIKVRLKTIEIFEELYEAMNGASADYIDLYEMAMDLFSAHDHKTATQEQLATQWHKLIEQWRELHKKSKAVGHLLKSSMKKVLRSQYKKNPMHKPQLCLIQGGKPVT